MFKYEGDNSKIIEAVKLANDEKLQKFVIEMISSSNEYDMSNTQPSYLASEMNFLIENSYMKINVYCPRWKYSKAMGYYSASNPNTVNINGYKIGSMSVFEMVSLFYHEYGHYVDANLPGDHYANHGSNSSSGKSNTFQYSINRYVYKYFGLENAKPEVKLYTPWYRRFLNFVWRI